MEEREEEQLACEVDCVHDEKVSQVRRVMPSDDMLYDLAELFKVFGDSTRTRILSVLFEQELCVCDIAEILGMTKYAVSHQLRILRNTKLVKSRRNGKEICYSLADDHVEKIFALGLEHLSE